MLRIWLSGLLRSKAWWGVMAIALVIGMAEGAIGQIVPDDTLGNEGSRVRNFGAADAIDGGARRGANLFHSFRELNVGEGRAAYFLNPSNEIRNILSRVTGNNRSEILGTLGVFNLDGVTSEPNLFLINPNGIIFGPNARLDVGGSFVGTTANAIGFGTQGFFSTTNPEAPSPLLTLQPSAFLFNQISTQPTNSIESRASLAVPEGHSLLLVGGQVSPNINSTGNILITREGESEGRLRAPGGRIEIGGLAAPGTIRLKMMGNDLSLHLPTGVPQIDVFLTGSAELDVTSGSRGDIGIYARNIYVRGGSDICAGIGATSTCGSQATGFGSFGSRAGDINLDAQETVVIADPVSSIENAVNVGAIGNSGGINIQARSLIVRDGGQISASTNGQGNAGNISIYTSNSVALTGQQNGANSGIYNSSDAESNNGNGGRITINTPYLSITDNARLLTYTSSTGAANDLVVKANRVLIEKSQVGSAAFDLGNAGNVIVRATNSIELRGEIASQQGRDFGLPGGLFSQVDLNLEQSEIDNSGTKGGRIFLETNYLSIGNGSRISVSTFGTGNAGNLLIRASAVDIFNTPKYDHFFPTGILSGVLESVDSQQLPRGNGGNITIDADRLSISHDGQIDASTEGLGNAGSIRIQTRLLSIENNGLIRGSTSGRGNAGDISLHADNMQLNGTSLIVSGVQPGGTGRGGNINIQTRLLSLTQGSQIGASVFRAVSNTPGGRGQGGNIRVSASDSIMLSGVNNDGFSSGIVAFTERGASGQGGNIFVDTSNLRVTNGAVVGSSTSNFSRGGTIVINARNLEALSGGQILTATRNTGNAGLIRLNVTETLTLSGIDSNYGERLEQARQFLRTSRQSENGKNGVENVGDIVITEGAASGLFVNSTRNSGGRAGSVRITTERLNVQDGAEVAVNSRGTGQAGNLTISANDIRLDRGTFTAETQSTDKQEGANIALQEIDRLLYLQNGSQISARAFDNANGGNVTINANNGFVVARVGASQNNDIIARASGGNGGQVTITAQGILGLEQRSSNPANTTNDIDISSERGLQGTATLNIPNTDPSQGLIELPTIPIDATNQIAAACPTNAQEADRFGSFIISGRGGLPPNPIDLLSEDNILTEWVTSGEPGHVKTEIPAPIARGAIVEAQGWVVNAQGKVALVAQANPPALAPMRCPHSQ